MALTAHPGDTEAVGIRLPESEAVCLGLDAGDALVVLHRPDPAVAHGVGVLICPPFGWQEACAYRALRTWGRALAAAGYPAARLTLPATGDSAGEAADAQDLEGWTEAVRAGAEWLRTTTGCRRTVVIGIGLGGMIAYRAQAAGAAIDDLVLWAVPARGRSLLRELHSLARVIAALHPEDQELDAGEGAELNLAGYALSTAAARELEALDLAQLPSPATPDRRVLLLGRDGIAPDATLLAALRAAGTEVEVADGRDWAELMANPQQSRAPERTMELTLDWLQRGPSCEPGGAAASPWARPTIRARQRGVELEETPLWLDGLHGRIFGVLTQPRSRPAVPLCAVMVGAGAVPHTGPNRSWVQLARRSAALGVSALRVDLGGIGESDGEDPELLTEESFHSPPRDTEIGMVLDQLQARGVADRFILGGLCSGAYIAQRRGREDARVCGLILINMFAFEWSMQLRLDRDRWQRLSTELPARSIRSIDRELVARALRHARPDRAWRLVSRASERQQRHEAIRVLDALRDRDVQTLLVLSRDEPLISQFDRQGLSRQLDRWPNLTLHRGRSRDHMYRASWYQREVLEAIERTVAATAKGRTGSQVTGER